MSTALRIQQHDAVPVDPAIGPASPVRLTTLEIGDRGWLHAAQLVTGDQEMLRALGLAERSRFRVCKAGDPWILLARGTRIGISDVVARCILVVREPRSER